MTVRLTTLIGRATNRPFLSSMPTDDEHLATRWSDEREHIEDLVNARFGSLLVLFELVVLAAVMCQEQKHLQIVLWTGFAFVAPVALAIFGVQWKLDWTWNKLQKDFPNDPIVHVSAACRHLSVRWIIGYLVPIQCVIALLLGAIFASSGILRVHTDSNAPALQAKAQNVPVPPR